MLHSALTHPPPPHNMVSTPQSPVQKSSVHCYIGFDPTADTSVPVWIYLWDCVIAINVCAPLWKPYAGRGAFCTVQDQPLNICKGRWRLGDVLFFSEGWVTGGYGELASRLSADRCWQEYTSVFRDKGQQPLFTHQDVCDSSSWVAAGWLQSLQLQHNRRITDLYT